MSFIPVMTTSELYYFICRCLAMDKEPGAYQLVKADLTAGRVPWEEFVWMGSSQFVLPALYSTLKRNDLLRNLPGDLADYMAEIYTLNHNRNLSIIEQSREIARLLNEAGIEPVFLKGAAHLLQGLYREPGDRIMSDIDILIHPDQIQQAADILCQNGYSHPEVLANDDFEKHHHLPGFENPDRTAMVELHHTALADPYGKLLKNEEAFTTKVEIKGLNASVLSLKNQKILSFVHDQLVDDDFKYKSVLIKGMYDFYLLWCLGVPSSEPVNISGYDKIYNTYCYLVSEAFYQTRKIQRKATRRAKIFKRQLDFLLDHPTPGSIYQLIVLYRLRIQVILKTVITAPFSRGSRRYFKKKAGSIPALKAYLKRLKREFEGEKERG